MKRKPGLGRAESDILRFIADKSGATVREVGDYLSETKGQTRTTALNVMERLREKGFLVREKGDNGVFCYTPKDAKAKMLRGMVRDFVDQMLGGSSAPLAAYLAEEADLSAGDIERLKQAIAALEAREPQTQTAPNAPNTLEDKQ